MSAALAGPLDGIKVLDLTRILAGPYATMLLGDMGADVVKVEPPGGDDSRTWGPPFAAGESAYFVGVNRNKRGAQLDLSREADRLTVRALARDADVLIENFKLGTMERWGLGYEEVLRQENPSLVYCSITGYGRTGPLAHLPGYDPVIEAVSGLMSVTGEADGAPMKFGVALVDIITGHQAAIGILAALHRRGIDGLGQRVDVSLLETALSVLANQASSYLLSDRVPTRHGNAHPAIVPFEVFPTKSGDIMVCAGNDRLFRKLCALLDLHALADDQRFATNPSRVAHRDELNALLAGAFLVWERTTLVAAAEGAGVPLGPVNTLDEAFAQPQVAARDMVVALEHPTIGTIRQVGLPIKLGRTPATLRYPPPLLGQHTSEVLEAAAALAPSDEPAEPGSGDTAEALDGRSPVSDASPPDTALLEAFRERFEASPTWRAFGQRITGLDAGAARVQADVESFTNVMGSVHGGVLAVLTDSAMAVAVRTEVGLEPLVVTVEMKVTFLAAIDAPIVVADARVLRSGGRLAFAEARVTSAKGSLVAAASATFAIQRPAAAD